MRKIIVLSMLLVLGLSLNVARADILTGGVLFDDTLATFSYSGTSSPNVYLTPMAVTDTETSENFTAFCADIRITTSGAFGSGSGQEYNRGNLDSLRHSYGSGETNFDAMINMIQDLFSYTYSSAFDQDGVVYDPTVARAIQMAVWEVLTEVGGNPNEPFYGIRTGDFQYTGGNNELANLTDSYLQAMQGDCTWESLGLEYTPGVNLIVYTAVGTSQPLIRVDGPTSSNAATPEPATLLVLGLGLAGLPAVRRFRKK